MLVIFLVIMSLNFWLDYDKLFVSLKLIFWIGILMKNKRINLFFKIDRETTSEDENMIIWLLIA